MAYVAGHLSVAALEERYEACEDVTSSRHFQAIWLLAKGRSTGEVAAMTSFGRRWIEQLVERYNALGPAAMGDLRRGNGALAKVSEARTVRRPGQRARVSRKCAARRRSSDERQGRALDGGRTGASLARAATRLGGVAGDRLVVQKPRPRNPKAATPEEQEAFKKNSPKSSPRKRRSIPTRRSRPLRPTNTGSA